MSETRYDLDPLAWSEHQADLLRRLAAGGWLDEAVDWTHVIEEVQDVGLSELRACRSALRLALVHLLKLHVWPDSQATGHWMGETIGFLAEARDRFAPSMRQRIGLDDIYATALLQVIAETRPGQSAALPATCPLPLQDLLACDVADLVTRLQTVAPGAA